MPPLYRMAEVALYALLNFLPFLVLAIYPFRNSLRFSRKSTGFLIGELTVIQLSLIHISRNNRLQEVMLLIEELVKQIPMAEKLMEIKGVGIKTVSGFLAEAGDITRFSSPKELQKLAGLALVENSSGKHKGQTTISRRGRKRLRYLLFEAAMSLVGKNPEFGTLHHYYTTRKINQLKKMQSLMAVAAKLIRAECNR